MHVPFLPTIHCAFSLSLSLSLSLSSSLSFFFFHSLLLPYVAIPHSPLHLAFIDASFPRRCTHRARLVIFQFPSLALPPFVLLLLDTVKRLNATTQSRCGSCLIFVSPVSLICSNGAICCDATEEKKNRFSVFTSFSVKLLCVSLYT